MITATTHTGHAARSHRASPLATAALTATLGCYLVLLVWAVLWKLGVPTIGSGEMRALKLMPFVATPQYGQSAPLEVAANFVLFAPFGGLLRLLTPAARWWRVGIVVACASIALEIAQYILAIGMSDSTDVIVNTAGGLAGFAVIAALLASGRSRVTARPEASPSR